MATILKFQEHVGDENKRASLLTMGTEMSTAVEIKISEFLD